MKFRKLKRRGVVRWFCDKHKGTLWRWQAGKMERNNGDGWGNSVRFPHKSYEEGWKEIKLTTAQRAFPDYYFLEKKQPTGGFVLSVPQPISFATPIAT